MATITVDFVTMIVVMCVAYTIIVLAPLSWLAAGTLAAWQPHYEVITQHCADPELAQVWYLSPREGLCNVAHTKCISFTDEEYWHSLDTTNEASGSSTNFEAEANILSLFEPLLLAGVACIVVYNVGFVMMLNGMPTWGMYIQGAMLLFSWIFYRKISQAGADLSIFGEDAWGGLRDESCETMVTPLMGTWMVHYIHTTQMVLLSVIAMVAAAYALYIVGAFRSMGSLLKRLTGNEPTGTVGEESRLLDDAQRFKTRTDSKKVLVLMSHTGGGHRMSAEALSTALENLYGSAITVEILDIWADYANWPFDDLVNHYRIFSQYPWLWKVSYDFTQFPITRLLSEIISDITTYDNFKRAIFERNPDLVVSVHPLCQTMPTRIVAELNEHIAKSPLMRDRLPVKFVTIVTDLASAHTSWFSPDVDITFAPTEVLRDAAIAMGSGITKDQFRVHGLPIRPIFWTPSDTSKEAMRVKLGLDPRHTTVLLMAGGDGVGKVQAQAESIAKHLGASSFKSQVVVVCGHNKVMADDLRRSDRRWPDNVNMTILGFTTNIDEYMVAADILATKAGPGTICEAMILGLPLVLTSFLPGQEEGNVPYVVDGGFGVHIEDTEVLGIYIKDILSDRERLQKMSQIAKLQSKPKATLEIAKDVGRVCFRTTPDLPQFSVIDAGLNV